MKSYSRHHPAKSNQSNSYQDHIEWQRDDHRKRSSNTGCQQPLSHVVKDAKTPVLSRLSQTQFSKAQEFALILILEMIDAWIRVVTYF